MAKFYAISLVLFLASLGCCALGYMGHTVAWWIAAVLLVAGAVVFVVTKRKDK